MLVVSRFFLTIKKKVVFLQKIFLVMRKEIGKWFMDIAKYVATAVLISSFLGGFEQKWIMYSVGTMAVILSFFIGLYFIKDKKNNDKK